MKKSLSVLLGCSSILSSAGQIALKGNLTDPVLGRYGISVERRMNEAFSAGAEVDLLSREVFLEGLSWFLSQNAQKRGLIVEPFVRWYPTGAEDLDGVYASFGGFLGFAKYFLDEPDGLGRHTWSVPRSGGRPWTTYRGRAVGTPLALRPSVNGNQTE